MKSFRSVLMFLVLLAPPVAFGAAPPAPPPEVAELINRWLADPSTKAPGIGIAAVNKSGLLWSGAFGLANVESRLPATTRTRWQFASVTKVYTTLMLAQLAHEGKIDLDAPLSRYLPEFKPRYPEPGAPPLTLRHLASHTAGVVNGWGQRTHTYTGRQLLEWQAQAGLSVQPGFQYKYANPGFAVIGLALERATGRSYAELLRARVFQPLGLHASGLTALPPHPELATSYGKDGDRLVARPPSPLFGAQDPASALVSTVEDVARFVQAHLADGPSPLIEPEVRDILFTPNVALEGNRGLGLGWFCSWRDNLPYWSHVGAWNTFYSRIVIRPDVGIGFALSTNGSGNPEQLIAPLLKLLAAHADTSRLDAVAGDYVDATGRAYTVHRPPGPELNLEIKDVGRLLPMTRHTYRLHKDGGAGGDWVRFVVEDGRRVMLWETGRLVRRE